MPYSYKWCAGVVDTYQAIYPRASEIVGKVLKISRNDLIKLLSEQDSGWENYKAIVNLVATMLDRRRQYGPPVGTTTHFVEGIIAWGVSHGRIANRALLTDTPLCAIDKKHVSTGVPDEAKPIQGPSFFPNPVQRKEAIGKWTIGDQLELPFGSTMPSERE